jgi:multimeric flavodoxin WrbA
MITRKQLRKQMERREMLKLSAAGALAGLAATLSPGQAFASTGSLRVALINGSPREKGCTFTALEVIAETLNGLGVESEFFWLGTKPLAGCIACDVCRRTGECALKDRVNEFTPVAERADGFIFGSPVHFAGSSGTIKSFMDRVFFSALCGKRDTFYLKPAAAVTAARRSGNVSAFDALNKHFTLMEMPVISSRYWNMVFGMTPEDVRRDVEGLQIMRVLARNMAWFLRCKQAAQAAGVPMPEREPRISLNFMR